MQTLPRGERARFRDPSDGLSLAPGECPLVLPTDDLGEPPLLTRQQRHHGGERARALSPASVQQRVQRADHPLAQVRCRLVRQQRPQHVQIRPVVQPRSHGLLDIHDFGANFIELES